MAPIAFMFCFTSNGVVSARCFSELFALTSTQDVRNCVRAKITADIIISSHIRRNRPGDRNRALELILPVVESGGKVASDIYCLCGRIYKDMFMSSGFTDQRSRDQACYWYSLFSVWKKAGSFFFFF